MTTMGHCPCGQLGPLLAEVDRLKVANDDDLRDGLEARADAEIASRQLAGVVTALRDIATRPVVERNPDGDDQAAHTMQMIAREAIEALEEQ